MSWPTTRLEELASPKKHAFVGGPFGSKLTSRDYVEEGVPVIRGTNLNGGRYLDMDGFVFVSGQKVHKDLTSNLAHARDLVFTQRGTLGQVAIIPDDGISDRYVVSQSQMKLTVDEEKADRLFLYYYFTSRVAFERIANLVSSSGVPHINLTILRNFEVPVPPVATQKRIAQVLANYDDLIENNRRRIQLLEESAQLLYKEWFVHLRFPGHEHVKVINGLPEGWRTLTLAEVCKQVVDGTHDSPKPADSGYFLVTGRHIVDGFIDFTKCYRISAQDHTEVMKRSKPEQGDIIFSNIGTLGSTVLVDEEFEFSIKNVALFKPQNELFSTYLYSHFSHPWTLKGVLNLASGTSQKFLGLKTLRGLRVSLPDETLLSLFHEIVAPILRQRSLLRRHSNSLVGARELLLPRLMNGEVAA